MSYLIHDAETTIVQSYKRKANPFDQRNHVVANGFKRPDSPVFHHYYGRDTKASHLPLSASDRLLVGFNYKFDLLWHWKRPELQKWLRSGGKIWCCQYAEYLLEGQTQASQMCSLDYCAVKYGGTTKIDIVKEMWKQGTCTTDIQEDILIEYLEDDIKNTEIVFLAQVARAREQNQLIDIMERMEGLLATTMMEFNGVYVDREQAAKDQYMLECELHDINTILDEAIPELPEGLEFKWGSNIHKSCLLFGGTVKYQKWAPHLDEAGNQLYSKKDVLCAVRVNGETIPLQAIEGKFGPIEDWTEDVKNVLQFYKGGKKKGELKTKKVKYNDTDKPKGAQKDFFFKFDPITKPEPEWEGKLTDGSGDPIYSTAADVIEALGHRDIKFLKALSMREKIAKDLGTYYKTVDKNGKESGMLTCVMEDGIIHHKLNHSLTVTTRLSSSDPNLQNITRKDYDHDLGREKSVVKRMFTSRFTDGVMGEIDYSQLEVVIQGLLTGDPVLIADIQAGIDFHCKRLSAKLDELYEEIKRIHKDEDDPRHQAICEGRTDIKGFTFQRAYGAGAKAIALATGMSVDAVEELICIEEKLYPGIAKFYDAVQQACEDSRTPTSLSLPLPDKPDVYVQCARGYYKSPTQALFSFMETPNPAWLRSKIGRDTSFYRPHIQNYPIQGVGGQVVQYILGKLFRKFIETNNFDGRCLMVNTVHDCVWFDYSNEAARKEIEPVLIAIMESIPAVLNKLYKLNCQVPFPVEAEHGPNMLNLHH